MKYEEALNIIEGIITESSVSRTKFYLQNYSVLQFQHLDLVQILVEKTRKN